MDGSDLSRYFTISNFRFMFNYSLGNHIAEYISQNYIRTLGMTCYRY